MVEEVKNQDFIPTQEEKALIARHLGQGVVVDTGYKKTVNLSLEEADARARCVSDIEYDFSLALQKGEYYIGNATINFYLDQEPGAGELFLNLQSMAISSLIINGQKIEANEQSFKDQKIALEMKDLARGWNTVQLQYMNAYNKNSTGMHTFTDLKDGLQYLYSQCEAFHCFRIFPVFDQPNLKAKMTLCVTVPEDWVAVGNGIDRRHHATSKEGKRILERQGIEHFLNCYDCEGKKVQVHIFEETPKISTYLFAICAGPYHVFEDLDPMHVPQRIFVRQSLKENMRHELVFGITKTTIEFYQKSFGARYPFTKVDHVMCADYKYGAMENVGCITYADSIMCAQKHMDTPQLTFFCVVVQHELAHMWFGNLVTMRWWNDLWLNEAFATSISYYACAQGGPHVEEFKPESWIHMAGYKRWGLQEDLMPSNHKIQADCRGTDMAESLIDGITYGKGSSLIKQVIFLMGWETFSHGLKIYFKRHQWSNTELPDFIGALQEGYEQKKTAEQGELNLTQWAETWLQSVGTSEIKAEYTETDGKFDSFLIRQTPHKYADKIFRKQTINVGLYDEHGALLENVERVEIEALEKTILTQFVGKEVPSAILLNNDDWGFGHFVLDEPSVRIFEERLSKIENPLNRATIIGQVMAMVRQLQYPSTRLPIIMNQLMTEKNQNLINAVFTALVFAKSNFLPMEAVSKFNFEVSSFFFKKAKAEVGNEKMQMFCIDKAMVFVTAQEHLKMAANWIYTGKIAIDGEELNCEMTNEHKYAIVKSYCASVHFTLDEKKDLRLKCFESDESDAGKTVQKHCDQCLPEPQLKEQLWEEITNEDSKESLIDLKVKIAAFWQRNHQLDLIEPYMTKFYEVLPRMVDKRDRQFSEVFMAHCSPAFMGRKVDEDAYKAMLDGPIASANDFFSIFIKKQIETIDLTQKSRTLCETYKTD